MKKNVCRIVALVAVTSMPLFADPPVPIAYSNEVKMVRYERDDGWRQNTNNPLFMERINYQTTNAPAAIIHVVTYGVGTNAMFRLWTCEALNGPGEPWRNPECVYYNNATWITTP